MHAFDARRRNEDFIKRALVRQAFKAGGIELEGYGRPRVSGLIRLEEVCSLRALHKIEEAAQNTVFVCALDLVEPALDRSGDRGLGVFARSVARGFEALVEQANHSRHDI